MPFYFGATFYNPAEKSAGLFADKVVGVIKGY